MTHWIFAYGSNMNLEHVRGFLAAGYPGAVVEASVAAFLPGWRLVWNYRSGRWKAGAANVERADGTWLPGVALRVNQAGLDAVDRKEGAPHFYQRRQVAVRLASGDVVDAWLYAAVPTRTVEGVVPPSREYLDLLVAGARAASLPEEHVAALERVPVATPALRGS